MEKEEARRIVKEALKALSPAEVRSRSKVIAERLLQLPSFRESRTVMFFISLPHEVETIPMIEESLKLGKRVVAPVTREEILAAEVTRTPEGLSLVPGAFGIMEPTGREVPPGEIDFVAVPGLAFDLEGNRLGRGKGYYDRFLNELKADAFLCGVAFECQVLKRLPHDDEDIPVYALITERRLLRFRKRVRKPSRRFE